MQHTPSPALSLPAPPASSNRRGVKPFLLALLFTAIGLTYILLHPFLHSVILAVVAAGVFHPLYLRILAWCGYRKNLAATIVSFLIVIAIMVPLFFIAIAMMEQGIQLTKSIQTWATADTLYELKSHPQVLGALAWVKENTPFIEIKRINLQGHLIELTRTLSESLLHHCALFLGAIASLVTQFAIAIFIIYFLLRDGQTLLTTIKRLSPLRTDQEDRIVEKIRTVSRSVLLGSLFTMLSEGAAGGIGLAIVGMPALFWGSIMAFASLIPIIGTALIWLPAVGYLCLLGHWRQATFLFLWCAIVITFIDNFLRPLFMQGKTGLSTFYIFLAMLGGIKICGIAGILYGPLILTFAMVMLSIYEEEFRDILAEDTPTTKMLSSEQ